MAGQGIIFEELTYILNKINRPQLVGVCFNVAHLFIAGYDIEGKKGW